MNKRLQLLIIALSTAGLVTAQSNQNKTADPTHAVKVTPKPATYGHAKISSGNPITAPSRASRSSRNASIGNSIGTTAVIGESQYDLQTNASIDNRLHLHGDGTISAAFTFSNGPAPAFANRGTGYNYFNGSSWGAKPTASIESERIGWPSLNYPDGVAGSGEVIISHSTANDQIHLAKRTQKGTGAWTEVQDPANSKTSGSGRYMIWPRTAVGGANNKTIHMIAVTEPTGGTFSGTLYQGMNGALLYSRSTNGGATWDIVDSLIPHIDNSLYSGVGGDTYAIDAKGNVVTIAVFGRFGDVVALKSMDNGLTWDKYTIADFPYDNFEIDDRKLDTTITSDGAGDIIIDDNNDIHVFYGSWRFIDDDTTDAQYSTFPYLNGLDYWNENMPEGKPARIANMEDKQAGFPAFNTIADYGSKSVCSFPSVGIDANGHIYLTYMSMREDLSGGSLNYNHIYGMMSEDHGCTWMTPVDLTDLGTGFEECAYSAVARTVDNNLHFIYQEDNEPGTSVGPVEHAAATNDIIYTALPKTTLNTTPNACVTFIEASGELCAPDSIMLTAACGQSYSWNTGETTASIWVKNYGTYSVDITTDCGVITETYDVTAPTQGPDINPVASYQEICQTGSQTVIRVPDAGAASTYNWNNTGQTQVDSFVVQTPGTYSVAVTNCGGTTTETITIGQLTSVDASVTGRKFLCPGESSILSVKDYPNANYTWTDGISQLGTSSELTVNSTGTYYINIDACGATITDNDSVVVEVEPQPSIDISAVNGILEACEGDLPIQLEPGNLQVNASVRWFEGTFSNEVTSKAGISDELLLSSTSESGTYFAYSYNSCGDSLKSNELSVTIEARPAKPSLTYDATTNTFSATAGVSGTFKWYVAGVEVPGVTSSTFDPDAEEIPSGSRISVSVTANGSSCESEPTNDFLYTTSVAELSASNYVQIFPNPSSGKVYLKNLNKSEQLEVTVKNMTGQIIHTTSVEADEMIEMELSSQSKGVYFVSFKGDTAEGTARLIID